MITFMFGTKLAKFQDSLFTKYLEGTEISSKERRKLGRFNAWVWLASRIAPNNLVLRHYMLQHIILGKDTDKQVHKQIEKLAVQYQGEYLWAEGYSYWMYVRAILIAYIRLTQDPVLKGCLSATEESFAKFSFEHLGTIYPPIYGDCRKVKLSPIDPNDFKLFNSEPEIYHPLVHFKNRVYDYYRYPLGGNTHTQKQNVTDNYNKGYIDFDKHKFYEGYDKKYSSWLEELKDIIQRMFIRGRSNLCL
jgi:hypothetical protein